MDIGGFKAEQFLPFYLTDEQKGELARALDSFSVGSNLYTALFPDEALQGDCWDNIPYFDVSSGVARPISGVFLSNSCDIDPNNPRDFPVHLVYAPLISLHRYRSALLAAGLGEQAVEQKLEAIRGQRITTMLYFPAGLSLKEESIASLDRATSIPYALFKKNEGSRKLFTLNQLGHYLFSFKLSIHFCRLHEGIVRGA